VTNPETQLASFLAKYDPATVRLGKALRAKLRDRLPGLSEVVYVYENQNPLVIRTHRPRTIRGASDCFDPRCVKLFFGQAPSCRSRTRTSRCKVAARRCVMSC
jgi:hypothetical protein